MPEPDRDSGSGPFLLMWDSAHGCHQLRNSHKSRGLSQTTVLGLELLPTQSFLTPLLSQVYDHLCGLMALPTYSDASSLAFTISLRNPLYM